MSLHAPELTPIDNPYLAPFDGSFSIADAPTDRPDDAPSKAERNAALADARENISDLQHRLYANDHRALLLVFQGLDAAGKDSAIRAILTGVNPAGVQVASFKQPSTRELDHDFLWRTTLRVPERGCIGVFNRSHYEEVLVVRVHPAYLEHQRLPRDLDLDDLWRERYDSIRNFEQHLAHNGTAVVKFWLHVGQKEQAERFLARLDDPAKHWKFSAGDVREARLRPQYLEAVEDMINATSRPEAPWYVIPADSKSFARMTMARIIAARLESFDLRYPEVAPEERATFNEMREQIRRDLL